MSHTRFVLPKLGNEIGPQLGLVQSRKDMRGLGVKVFDIAPLSACLLTQDESLVCSECVSFDRPVSLIDPLAQLCLGGVVVAITLAAGFLTLCTRRLFLVTFDVPDSGL